ncbi:AAA family ATPase [Dactylosporangium darangshiense]|uniref:MoxR family ATPase n=1 Tax=Dactylosporangium darangshiense TaxID=579108 RepID=A0ABP8DUQ1_9ACTN
MSWRIFTGTGAPGAAEAWRALPEPPPWRDRSTAVSSFVMTDELRDAVNAALHLRRPLLLTGAPGSGKSTLVNVIADELDLGAPLAWHVTSRSTREEALYQYDALGRLHATQMPSRSARADDVERFVTLGPLGTALADPDRPRAVLIDEIDKSDLDLPGDLLNVLDQGEFDIPPLVRAGAALRRVRGADRGEYAVADGVVRRRHWPVIVLTSNGERTFPAAFLRRCIRFQMPPPSEQHLRDVVSAYLAQAAADAEGDKIAEFARRVVAGESLALDQLLNFVYLVSGEQRPDAAARSHVERIVLEGLTGP